MIETRRIRLRPWREADRDAFAAMLADPEVMYDLGGPMDRPAADAKLDRYVATFREFRIGRMAIEGRDGAFLGYAGVAPLPGGHPLGPGFDIGWRLTRRCWGHGYATEAARAALNDAFERVGLGEVVAFTAPGNLRSQAVMERLGMMRDPARDFTTAFDRVGTWHGLVWVARPA